MGKVKAVIWDLDGTLLDTLDDLTDSLNAALRENGLPEHTRDRVRQMVGNGTRQLIIRAIPDGIENPAFQKVTDAFLREYAMHNQDKTKPYQGIPEALQALAAHGIRHAVVSNKIDFAVRSLCRDYFGTQISASIGDDPSRARKPAPDSVFAALEALGVSLSEAVYVGDSNVDIETAGNAGIPGIGVLWGFRDRANLEAAGASYIALNPEELVGIILSL
ncbi:MAG: HAD family hydrolase [Clostridia bacterium]|nr:HAD family hydrolase [Clostridia bacterium]